MANTIDYQSDRRHPVTVIPQSPYDSDNARLRS
jgi:hypothetical protein